MIPELCLVDRNSSLVDFLSSLCNSPSFQLQGKGDVNEDINYVILGGFMGRGDEQSKVRGELLLWPMHKLFENLPFTVKRIKYVPNCSNGNHVSHNVPLGETERNSKPTRSLSIITSQGSTNSIASISSSRSNKVLNKAFSSGSIIDASELETLDEQLSLCFTSGSGSDSVTAWRSNLKAGDICDVLDIHNMWYEGRVLQVTNQSIVIHFRGCSDNYNETISSSSVKELERLQPPYTHVTNWRSNLNIGDLVDYVDSSKKWLEAKVTSIDKKRIRIVTLDGSAQTWVGLDTDCIVKYGRYTSMKLGRREKILKAMSTLS